jgi:hypothetical protein
MSNQPMQFNPERERPKMRYFYVTTTDQNGKRIVLNSSDKPMGARAARSILKTIGATQNK